MPAPPGPLAESCARSPYPLRHLLNTDPLLPLHDFFITLGGGSAALLGLLFVAVSVNARHIVSHEDTKELARQTFITFVSVLIYALFMLLPQPLGYLAFEIGIASAIMVLIAGPRFVRSLVRRGDHLPRRTQILRYGLTLALQLVILAAAVELERGDVNAASWLIGTEIALLVGAVRNSWEMLIELGGEPE